MENRQVIIKCIICLMFVFLLAACSEDVNESINNGEQNTTTENNNKENDNRAENIDPELDYAEMSADELAEYFPVTEAFTSLIPRGHSISSDIDISETEQEVLDTLSEFEAVKDDSSTTLTLPDNILFDFDSDELRSEAYDEIKKLAQVIDTTDGDVQIIGHTDNKGETNYNQELSEARAESVMRALVDDQGVDESRLIAEGRGETEPVARNAHSNGDDDPDGRQKNRRVEVIIDDF